MYKIYISPWIDSLLSSCNQIPLFSNLGNEEKLGNKICSEVHWLMYYKLWATTPDMVTSDASGTCRAIWFLKKTVVKVSKEGVNNGSLCKK